MFSKKKVAYVNVFHIRIQYWVISKYNIVSVDDCGYYL